MTLKKKFAILGGAVAFLIAAMFLANLYSHKKREAEIASVCHAAADKETVQDVEKAIFAQNLGAERMGLNNINPFTGNLLWGMIIKSSYETKNNIGPLEIVRHDFNWIQILEDGKTKKVMGFTMVMTKGYRINLNLTGHKMQPWKRGDYLSASGTCEIDAEYY